MQLDDPQQIRALETKSPAQGGFKPFDSLDPHYPKQMRLSLIGESFSEESRSQISHWVVLSYDSEGHEQGLRPIYSIQAPENQVVIDALPYCNINGTEYVFLTESQRPAIAARALLVPGGFIDESPAMQRIMESGRVWGLPGTYMRPYRGQTSIESSTHFITASKLGLKPIGQPRSLGGAHYPSIGSSTELSIPNAQEVAVPEQIDRIRFGQHFESSRRVRAFTHQQVLDWYLAGELPDFRAVLATLERAKELGNKLSLPINIPTESPLPHNSNLVYPIMTFDQVKRLAIQSGSDRISSVVLLRLEHSPPKPFLRSFDLAFSNLDSANQPLEGAPKLAQVIVRQGGDSADSLCWFESAEKIYVVVKRGLRIATEVLNQQQHPINLDTNIFHIESPAVALNGEKSERDIASKLIDRIRTELKLNVVGKPTYMGATFPSPGFNPELVHGFICEVDPTDFIGKIELDSESIDPFCVELNDFLDLYRQGVVRDGRSVTLAHLLKLAKHYPDQITPQRFTAEENEDFQAVICKHSPLQRYLLTESGTAVTEVDKRLCRNSITYLRLKEYGECDLGFILSDFEQEDAPEFYDQLIEILPRFSSVDPRLVPFRIAHDLCHYSKKPVLPFEVDAKSDLKRNADGAPKMREFEDYLRECRLDECDAVWYSDSLLPKLFGLAEARSIFGEPTLGEAFDRMGLTQRQARDAIRTIEGNGKIPDSILTNPEFPKFANLIVNHLLYRHCMDEHQIKIRYQSWLENPELCEVAAKLFTRTSLSQLDGWDIESEELRKSDHPRSSSTASAHAISRGFNPLRAEIAQARNQQFRIQAFKLANLRHLLRAAARSNDASDWQARDEELRIASDRLIESYHTLGQKQQGVNNINCSDENRAALSTLRKEQRGSYCEAVRLYEVTMRDRSLITEQQFKQNAHKLIPFISPYPKDPRRCSEDILGRVHKLAIENFNRLGMELPKDLEVTGPTNIAIAKNT